MQDTTYESRSNDDETQGDNHKPTGTSHRLQVTNQPLSTQAIVILRGAGLGPHLWWYSIMRAVLPGTYLVLVVLHTPEYTIVS